MSYLEGLNPNQLAAVTHIEGPLLVLAGAGSGKTRVITHRIVNLIHQGVAPHNILAVTFTNKAASEMRTRVLNLIETYPVSSRAHFDSSPLLTTFHALGVKILREHHATLNLLKHFTIFDRNDSLRAIKAALEKAGFDSKQFEPKKILGIISRSKGEGLDQNEFMDSAESYIEKVASEVWQHYERILRTEHALDFDDLLLCTLQLLQNYPVIKETLQKRFEYIHIDEYQDTNKVQFKIAYLLAGDKQNICVVGDIDQNIYSWRGADISNVLQFERHFKNSKTIILEENYRSTQTIIAASNDIITKNKNRIEKNIFTNNPTGEKLALYAAMTGVDEADHVALNTSQLIATGVLPSDIAILYRTNFQSRILEEAFLQHDIPYQLLGTKFFERKEVKDVIAFLKLALNPNSTSELSRIVNVPPRGIGKVTALKMMSGQKQEINGSTQEKVKRFDEMMLDILDCANTKNLSATITFIIARTGLDTYFKKAGTEEDFARLENLRELVTFAARFDELENESALELFFETVALQSDQDELKDSSEIDAVRLMTIHAAKGLEFPYVFITGLEEGLFPHARLDDGNMDLEEERRLFYVALTRAEKKVFLSYAHLRTIFGSQRVNLPSSFLGDISKDHVEQTNPTGKHSGGYETTIYLD